jgi:hypothetical protein
MKKIWIASLISDEANIQRIRAMAKKYTLTRSQGRTHQR